MTPTSDDRLREIAEAIADERDVDWDALRARSPELASRLEALREVASLAAALRTTRDGSTDSGRSVFTFTWGTLGVLEPLGQGTFSNVYRAWDSRLERQVALKLRREDAPGEESSARRWLEEARRLARVRHPNVVTIYGADVQDGRAGIWTELIHGLTLEAWLAQHGPMGEREATVIGIDLCAALEAMHLAGLVHGDVKASNVMREGGPHETTNGEAAPLHGDSSPTSSVGRSSSPAVAGRIVLMDFGSAHEVAGRASDVTFGTPLTSAPEILRGETPTPSSDVYSMGVLLFRLVTGRYPVEARTREELLAALERGDRTSLRTLRPDVRGDFLRVVDRALGTEPGERFARAADLERALTPLIEGRPAAPSTTASRWNRRHVFAMAAAVTALLAIALMVVRFGTEQRRASDVASRPPVVVPETAPGAAGPAPTTSEAGAIDRAAAIGGEPKKPASDLGSVDLAALFRETSTLPEPLRNGGIVAPGDLLYLEFRAREPLHVYVLNEDRTGIVAVLFPLREAGRANPLSPRATHRLPGERAGRGLSWQVTSAGGQETFLVIASRQPLQEVEREVASLPQAREGEPVSYAELPERSLEQLRGVTGLVESPAPSRLAALARGLSRRGDSGQIWLQTIELRNMGR